MKNLRSKALCFILAFVFAFSTCTPVYASSNHGGGGATHDFNIDNYDDWSNANKVLYWADNVFETLSCISGIGNSPSNDQLLVRWFDHSEATKGYSSLAEFMAGNSSYNAATGAWTFSDNVINFVNEISAQKTYEYGYIPTSTNIDANAFLSNTGYNLFSQLVARNSDLCFYMGTNGVYNLKNSDGSTLQIQCRRIQGFSVPYAGVNYKVGGDITSVNTSFYTEEWDTRFDYYEFYLVDNSTDAYLYYEDTEGNPHRITDPWSVGSLNIPNTLKLYEKGMDVSGIVGYSPVAFRGQVFAPAPGRFYSNYEGAVAVFKSLVDLKNGTVNGFQSSYVPGFSGPQLNGNTITQQQINDYNETYNYYYGTNDDGGNGSGSGSGGSSGGSGFLDSFLNALGSLGDAILGILAKLLEFVTNGIELITNTFSKLTGLFQNGFVDFLTAVFPFMPSEWVIGITVALCLGILAVIWSFRK